jgi:hypothetical protein
MGETAAMEFFPRLFSGAGERARRRRRGFVTGAVAVTIAVAAGVLASQGAATVASGYRSESSSGILAEHLVSYPLTAGYPKTGVCRAAAPQTGTCESFFIILLLKRSAASTVVSFDGLSGKLKRVKVPPGAKWPNWGPYRTGMFFSGQIPTVSLLKSKNSGRGSGSFPAVRKSGYGTFHVLIALSDGSRIATDFREYLKRGWL